MKVEQVADFGDLCGESPVWDRTAQVLYWTDCGGRRFFQYDARRHHAQILQTDLESLVIAFFQVMTHELCGGALQ